MNILDAINEINQKLDRVMIDGMWSISDEVFELELWKLRVDNETISWRLKEQVDNREAVIAMYERGVK